MTDFVERLLARHLEEPAIRPRSASRFESAAAWPRSQVSTGLPRTSALGSRPFTRATAAASSVAPKSGKEQSVSQPAPVRQGLGAMQEPDSPPVRVPVRARPRDMEPSIDSAVEHIVGGFSVLRAPDPSGQIIQEPQQAAGDATSRPGQRHPADSIRPVAVSTGPRERARVPMVTRPEVSDAAASTASARRHPGEPVEREPDVVHVHIGRVEVRAVMPSPEPERPAPAPRAGPGPLSLDNYLAGKRRA